MSGTLWGCLWNLLGPFVESGTVWDFPLVSLGLSRTLGLSGILCGSLWESLGRSEILFGTLWDCLRLYITPWDCQRLSLGIAGTIWDSLRLSWSF